MEDHAQVIVRIQQGDVSITPPVTIAHIIFCEDCQNIDYDGELYCEYLQRRIESKNFFCAHGKRRPEQ